MLAYTKAWEGLKAQAEGNAVKDADALRLATSLLHDLSFLKFPQDERGLCNSLPLARERLTARIDAVGVAWLRKVMETPESAEAMSITATTADIFKPATPALKAAVATCGLVSQVPKMKLALDQFLWTEQKLPNIVAVIFWYAQACSIDIDLMNAISPTALSACQEVCTSVDRALGDTARAFQQSVAHLGTLAKKYEPLCLCIVSLSLMLEAFSDVLFCIVGLNLSSAQVREGSSQDLGDARCHVDVRQHPRR